MHRNRPHSWARSTLLLGVAAPLLTCASCPSRWADFRVHRLIAAEVGKIDGQGFEMKLRCEIDNPNSLGAELWNIRYRSTVGSHELGRGRLPGFVKKVSGGSRFELRVPVRVEYRRLPPQLPRMTRDRRLTMKTEVWFTAKTSLGSYEMHLTSLDQTRIDSALRAAVRGSFSGEGFRVRKIAFSGLGLRKSRLALTARVRNLMPFPVRIGRALYTLAINGRHFGRGELEAPLTLAAGASRDLQLPIAASHGAVARALGALATTDPQFRVRGELILEPPLGGIRKIPIDITADSSVFADDGG